MRDNDDVRFPEVEVQLTEEDDTAMMIVGRVRRALRHGGATPGEIEDFVQEAMSGDYDHLLQTCMRWVNVS